MFLKPGTENASVFGVVAPTGHDTFWKQEFRGLVRAA
jgi:hypothetical protein